MTKWARARIAAAAAENWDDTPLFGMRRRHEAGEALRLLSMKTYGYRGVRAYYAQALETALDGQKQLALSCRSEGKFSYYREVNITIKFEAFKFSLGKSRNGTPQSGG